MSEEESTTYVREKGENREPKYVKEKLLKELGLGAQILNIAVQEFVLENI